MSTEPKLTTPKNGQHVTSTQHEGVFEVVFVNALIILAPNSFLTSRARKLP